MAWPAIIALAGSVMQGMGNQGQAEAAQEGSENLARIGGDQARQTIAFGSATDDYYSQQNKQRRRDARAASFGGFSTRTKFKEPEGFTRKPLVEGGPPKPPVTVLEPKKKKKRSFLDRLTKPSLSPSGLGGGG